MRRLFDLGRHTGKRAFAQRGAAGGGSADFDAGIRAVATCNGAPPANDPRLLAPMKDDAPGARFGTRALVCAAALMVLGAGDVAHADVLVSNFGQGAGGIVVGGTALDHAQGFTTGSSDGRYTLSSVELRFRNRSPVDAPTVTVHSGTPRGTTRRGLRFSARW